MISTMKAKQEDGLEGALRGRAPCQVRFTPQRPLKAVEVTSNRTVWKVY